MPFLQHIDFAAPSWDLFLLLFFVIGVLLYGLSLGRDRILVIMVSIYMGLAIVTNAPYFQRLTSLSVNDVSFRVGAFLGVFLLLFFMLSRNALVRSLDLGQHGHWFHTIVFSVLHVGLLVSVALSFLPDAALAHFSSGTIIIFHSDIARSVWLVAPAAAMMIFSGSRRA